MNESKSGSATIEALEEFPSLATKPAAVVAAAPSPAKGSFAGSPAAPLGSWKPEAPKSAPRGGNPMATKVLAAMVTGGDEFSFASTFSDDDIEDAGAASPHARGGEFISAAMTTRDDHDGSHHGGVDIPLSAEGVVCLEGSRLPTAAAAAEIMGTSPNTAMMNAPNFKDEFFMYQVRRRGSHPIGW